MKKRTPLPGEKQPNIGTNYITATTDHLSPLHIRGKKHNYKIFSQIQQWWTNRLEIGIDAYQTALSTLLYLPQLRATWPMSSVDNSGNVHDISAQNRTLTNNNAATFSLIDNTFAPYVSMDGINQSLSRDHESGLEISHEMTLGGWFYLTNTNDCGLISKYDHSTPPNPTPKGYLLHIESNTLLFTVSDTISQIAASKHSITTNTWTFVTGRLSAVNTQYRADIFLNANITTGSTGNATPATNNKKFYIGYNNDSNYLNGRAALCFLCATALPNTLIQNIYTATMPMFQ